MFNTKRVKKEKNECKLRDRSRGEKSPHLLLRKEVKSWKEHNALNSCMLLFGFPSILAVAGFPCEMNGVERLLSMAESRRKIRMYTAAISATRVETLHIDDIYDISIMITGLGLNQREKRRKGKHLES